MSTNASTITVNELPVKVIRKKIKNLHLAVYPPNGWVRIAVPEIIDDEAVRLAVISKLGWIKRQIKSFADQPRQSARELITRESHYYLGRRYLLDIAHTKKRSFIEIQNKKRLVLNINELLSNLVFETGSSGDLIVCCYLDSIFKFHSHDHLGKRVKPSLLAPGFLSTL